MTVNYGPLSEWVLVVIVLLDSIAYYIFEHKKHK